MSLFVEAIMSQTLDLLLSIKTELLLFTLAFVLHGAMFGGAVWKHKEERDKGTTCVGARKRAGSLWNRSPRSSGSEAPQGHPEDAGDACANGEDFSQALRMNEGAHERGDHRSVLRGWSVVRRSDAVSATHLAHVVEAMQRFKKDPASIISEVQSYLRRTPSNCTISYFNRLLEALVRSLDAELVGGLMAALPSLRLAPDTGTYEAVMQMHFSTRSFDEVQTLATDMRKRGVQPSPRTSLLLLKVALQTQRFDEALERFREVAAAAASEPVTASVVPAHVAAQLVELACKRRHVDAVLEELEAGHIPLTTDSLNAMLTECVRSGDVALQHRIEVLGARRSVGRNARTYQLLVRCARGDRSRIEGLLQELSDVGAAWSQDLVETVLQGCIESSDTALADQLYEQLRQSERGGETKQTAVFLALVRFYTEVGHDQKACDIFSAHVRRPELGSGADWEIDQRRHSVVLDARTERSLLCAALACGEQALATEVLNTSNSSDVKRYAALIRSCATRGSLDTAAAIFRSVRENGANTTRSLWNTALDACVEAGNFDQAQGLMKRMQDEGVADAVSYNTLIKAHLRQDHFERARAVVDDMRKAGFTPNHVTFNELVHAFARGDRECYRAQVWDIIDEMKCSGVKPNRITCSILLKNLNAKSSHADVVRTMELTESVDERMDEVLLSSVVEACQRVGKVSLVSQQLAKLQGDGAVKVSGAHTYGSLIKAYGYTKDIAGAWRCWVEMRSQHVRPTSITIGCMVEAVVSNGDVDGGYELICEMLDDEMMKDHINCIIYGSVLKGYGRAGRIERVLTVFDEMLSRGIAPLQTTYNAVIDACARSGQMGRVRGLVVDMKARGLTPNVITFSTMIKGYGQQGDMTAALETFSELRACPGCKADEIVYNTLLEGCVQKGLGVEGERLLEEMQASGIAPSNYTVSCAIRLAAQAGRLDLAFEHAETLAKRYRLPANQHVAGSLVQACLTCRNTGRALAAFERAVQDRILIDCKICQNLVRALLQAGNLVQAVSVLRSRLRLAGGGCVAAESKRSTREVFDDAFLHEVLAQLRAADDAGGAALATALAADIAASRPGFCESDGRDLPRRRPRGASAQQQLQYQQRQQHQLQKQRGDWSWAPNHQQQRPWRSR